MILSDFGLGRAWRGEAGQWKRSPFPCDAPESRQAGILDRRTDIFSLGATAYELLTGQAWPAGGAWPRWVTLRLRESPLLRGLLSRMTAPDPRDRYWDYQGLARDLERLLECYRRPPAFPGLSTWSDDRQATPRKRSRWARRLAGGGVDLVILLGVQLILRFLFFTDEPVKGLSVLGWLAAPSWLALALPRGSTLGQRVAGLRLIGREGRHPSWWRRGARALLLTPLFLSPLLLLLAPVPGSLPLGAALGLLAGLDLLAACGGRKGDALHDRWSGTRPVRERDRPSLFSYREAWLAALLSAVFPGLGQWYNGQYLRGLLVLLTCWMILPYLWGIVDAWRSARDLIRLARPPG